MQCRADKTQQPPPSAAAPNFLPSAENQPYLFTASRKPPKKNSRLSRRKMFG